MNIKKIIQIVINVLIIIGCAAYLPSVVGYNVGIYAIWSLFGISAIVLSLIQLLPLKSKKHPLTPEEIKVWSQIHLFYFWLATCVLFAYMFGPPITDRIQRNIPIVLWLMPLIPSFLMWLRINVQAKESLEAAKAKWSRNTLALLLPPFCVAFGLYVLALSTLG